MWRSVFGKHDGSGCEGYTWALPCFNSLKLHTFLDLLCTLNNCMQGDYSKRNQTEHTSWHEIIERNSYSFAGQAIKKNAPRVACSSSNTLGRFFSFFSLSFPTVASLEPDVPWDLRIRCSACTILFVKGLPDAVLHFCVLFCQYWYQRNSLSSQRHSHVVSS